MIQLLYATTNPSKLRAMSDSLKPVGIELKGLADMEGEIPDPPDEAGNSPLENARQKALFYYDRYHIPLFSCDSGLYFENVLQEDQPGIHVRTFNGHYLSDEEVLSYYSGLAHKYGDIIAQYRCGICLILDEEHIYELMDESIASRKFILTEKPHHIIRKGFPIDSLSKDIESGKYYYDLKDGNADDLVGYDGYIAFFREHLKFYNS